MLTVEALKEVYTALGGNAGDVADASLNVEVLNKISALYNGADDATENAAAVANIAAVAGQIGGGSIQTVKMTVINNGESAVELKCPCIGYNGAATFAYYAQSGTTAIDVLIVPDKWADLEVPSAPTSTSGAITPQAPVAYKITGDCSITFG